MTRRRIVLDETVLIRHLQGDRAATGLLIIGASGETEIWSLTLIRAEILMRAQPHVARPTRRLLDRLRWLDVTPDLVDVALELALGVPLRDEVEPLPRLTDLLVAAAARSLEAELVTLAPQRYPMCPGVRAAYG